MEKPKTLKWPDEWEEIVGEAVAMAEGLAKPGSAPPMRILLRNGDALYVKILRLNPHKRPYANFALKMRKGGERIVTEYTLHSCEIPDILLNVLFGIAMPEPQDGIVKALPGPEGQDFFRRVKECYEGHPPFRCALIGKNGTVAMAVISASISTGITAAIGKTNSVWKEPERWEIIWRPCSIESLADTLSFYEALQDNLQGAAV